MSIRVRSDLNGDSSVFERSVLDRMDRIDRALENIASMLCPICREKIIAEQHPEAEGDGKGHAK